MTSKLRRATYRTTKSVIDIDSAREAKRWVEAIEICRRSRPDAAIETLIRGEKAYHENDLDSARKEYNTVIDNPNAKNMAQEGKSLLGILEAGENNIEKATKLFNEVAEFLNSLDDNQFKEALASAYRVSVILEGQLIKASTEAENKQAVGNAIKSYQLVSQTASRYFRLFPTKVFEPIKTHYEEAVYQIPCLLYTQGEIDEAVQNWRAALNTSAVPRETPSKEQRSRVLDKLAQTLLYNFQCSSTYSLSQSKELVMVPKTGEEEGLMAALLVEEADLSDNVDVYDDIVYGYGVNNAFIYSIESLERAVANYSDDSHLWTQFALSLYAGGKAISNRTIKIITKILEVNPNDQLMLLLGAKTHVNYTENYTEAIKLCHRCIAASTKAGDKGYLKRAHHYLAVSLSGLAVHNLSIHQNQIHMKALEAFQTAQQLGCNDYQFYFHLSLEQAECRLITDAISNSKRALVLNQSFASAWLLFILLLTSQKLYQEASDIIKTALVHHPNNILLLYCQAIIELQLNNAHEALRSLRVLCTLMKQHDDEEDDVAPSDIDPKYVATPRVRSNEDITDKTYSAKSDTIDQKSLPDTRGKRTLEVGMLEVWVLLSKVFMKIEQYGDSKECLDAATQINAFNPDVVFQRGALLEVQGDVHGAVSLYKEALAFDHSHMDSLLKLGEVCNARGEIEAAEYYLSAVVRKYPFFPKGWFLLGNVLRKTKEESSAASCFKLSLELEQTAPILPFSCVKREL